MAVPSVGTTENRYTVSFDPSQIKPSDVSAYIVHLVGLSRRKEICDGRSAMKLNGIYSNFEQWRTQNDSRDFPFHSMLQTNHFIYYVGVRVYVCM